MDTFVAFTSDAGATQVVGRLEWRLASGIACGALAMAFVACGGASRSGNASMAASSQPAAVRDGHMPAPQSAAPLAARAGQLLWIRQQGSRATLWTGFGPTARRLPVPAGAFDADVTDNGVGFDGDPTGGDLGTEAHGGLVAAYPRCHGVAGPRHGTTCSIFAYSFASGAERQASADRCDDRNPVIDRGVLVFARLGAYDSGSREVSSGGCRPGTFVQRPGQAAQPLDVEPACTPTNSDFNAWPACVPTDLVDGTLVLSRIVAARTPPVTTEVTTEIRTVRLGQVRSRLVRREQATSDARGGPTGRFVASGTLDGEFVYWSRTEDDHLRVDLQRRPLAGGPVRTVNRRGRCWTNTGSDPSTDDPLNFTVAAGVLYSACSRPTPGLDRLTLTATTFR